VFENISPLVLKSIAGGFGVLLASTCWTAGLKWRNPNSSSVAKVWKIIGGWWIISLLLGAACLAGSTGLTILFCLASLLAIKEYLVVQKLAFIGRVEWLVIGMLVVIHYVFLWLGWKTFFLFIVPVMGYIYLPFLMLSRRKIEGLVHNLWTTQSGLMLCVYFLSFAPGLIFLNESPTVQRKIDPVAAFLFLFLTTELNDVFQFLTGKLFGHRKLVVEISPNKTVAGFFGGLLLTSVLTFFLAPAMVAVGGWPALLLGFCISLSGISGDLMFSSIKRTVGVKDFSNLIPGHGGVLDRLDSLVFTAPTLYCLLYILMHVD
jgi:phosphatidate cytidylyltransferase